jgi:hypothetical protein
MTTRIARRATAWWAAGAVLALAGTLGGCAGVQNAMNDVSNALQPKQEEPALPPPTSYCYRTLGKVNCYSQPLPGDQSNRLIGYQGPPPRSTSGTGPLSP